jgi:hypothetical protein
MSCNEWAVVVVFVECCLPARLCASSRQRYRVGNGDVPVDEVGEAREAVDPQGREFTTTTTTTSTVFRR